MKNFFFFIAAFCLPFFSHAQYVVDFENVQFLNGTNYWNGSDDSGGFTLQGASFNNSYNPDWMSWSGFAVSSETNTTVAGYENQYSCFAGSGANASQKFGLWYSNGEITFEVPTQPVSIALANTTYAALSMRDGDAYGKKFGSIYNANGDLDGTNGKDWFKLTIIGVNANNDVTGEIDFYLADFRSEDSLEHYILEQWETIDLTSLGTVHKILFEMNSSDIGSFGMNTPSYFSLDDFTFYQSMASNQESSLNDYGVFPNPARDHVTVLPVDNQDFKMCILNSTGVLIEQYETANLHRIDVRNLPNGVYFIQMISPFSTRSARVVVAH
jgi:hypothetical protein